MTASEEKLQRVLARLVAEKEQAVARLQEPCGVVPTYREEIRCVRSGVLYGLMTAIEILQKECK